MRRTRTLLRLARVADILALPITAISAVWFKALRTLGLQYMPASKGVLRSIGVFPVRDHYYEPMTNPAHLRYSLTEDRPLPGLDFNVEEQLSLLARFIYQQELLSFPRESLKPLEFHYDNASFVSGDSEYLYSFIRLIKPGKVIEIGCGFSSLMTQNAITRNKRDDPAYSCEHVCIEPYEQSWLEDMNIQIIRQRVENCDMELFRSLQRGDLLFIDSSHMIRPQGDVLFEMLEILPILEVGVYVHIHDIFTPRDYLPEWVINEGKLWNEQYLLEAFLSCNPRFRIIGALNFLKHHHPEALASKLPVLGSEMALREPGSFWIVKQ